MRKSLSNNTTKTHPNINFRSNVLLSLEHLGRSIGRRPAPRFEQLIGMVEVAESKIRYLYVEIGVEQEVLSLKSTRKRGQICLNSIQQRVGGRDDPWRENSPALSLFYLQITMHDAFIVTKFHRRNNLPEFLSCRSLVQSSILCYVIYFNTQNEIDTIEICITWSNIFLFSKNIRVMSVWEFLPNISPWLAYSDTI